MERERQLENLKRWHEVLEDWKAVLYDKWMLTRYEQKGI